MKQRDTVAATKVSWQFLAVRTATPNGYSWRWQKQGAKLVTSAPFDFYFDCVADARAHGYKGALPPGPRIASERLPRKTPSAYRPLQSAK